jgi:glycosyltransferase involved in cell wall biosynthesis
MHLSNSAESVADNPAMRISSTDLEAVREKASAFDVVMLTTVHAATDDRIFYREAVTLAASGLTVAVIGPHPRSEILDGVWIEALTSPPSRLRRFFQGVEVVRRAKRLRGRVFIFHDPELFGAALVLRTLGKKVVYDCHENVPAQILQKHWIPRPMRRFMSAAAWTVEWFGSRCLSGVAAAREAILPRFPKNRRILVRNFPTKLALASVHGQPVHLRDNILIYAGGLSRLRGIADLVEAFQHIAPQEAQLWLVGKFENAAFEQEILATAGPNVKWLGWMQHPEVLKLYASAKIGISLLHPTPSHRNSQPIKLYEYLAAGLPMLASNFPEFAPVVEGCGLQVDPCDPREIERAIRELLADADRLAEMSKTGRERVLTSFCWEGEAARLADFCRQLAK